MMFIGGGRMTRLIDISVPVSDALPTWPGDPSISVRPAKRIARGDAANVSHLSLGNHTGTHVDPPSHFIEGARTIDQLAPEVFVGRAWVSHLPDARGEIGPAELQAAGVPAGTERLLLKTVNSGTLAPGKEYRTDFVCLSPGAADWIVGRGVRLVGVDYLSIERAGAPFEHPVHRTLLGAGVVIVEGLDLSGAPAGGCELFCLPLLIAGGDGAPARAFIRPSG
jgi:arylformamidase